MIAAALLAAAVSAARPPAEPRYIVLHARVVVYGVNGSGMFALDRRTGRFARRFAAGAASESEGWNGTNAWRADATGMTRVQANAGERAEIIGWSRALVRAFDTRAAHVVVSSGRDRDTIRFEHFETRGGQPVPKRILSQSSQNGLWTADVERVDTPQRLGKDAFTGPTPSRDWSLAGVTRVPVSMDGGSPQIEVHVNGVALHFFLDTGGQNVVNARAARLAGLHEEGHGIVRGGGGGTASISYAFADSVRVGGAEMRHQPFIILPDGAFAADGVVGYELLARFGARLDMSRGMLELARHATAFGKPVMPVRFGYFDRQPQVRGFIDGIKGAFTIDTGSSLTAQVQAAVVREQRLVSRLHATVATYAEDIGGRYPIYLVRAGTLGLGSAVVHSPLLDLLTHVDPSDDPAIVANVGDGLLRRWVIVFDYAHGTLDLRPGGDPSGNTIHDRSGMLLAADGSALIARLVFSGTPAYVAGIRSGANLVAVDGRPVDARSLPRIRSLLRGKPGTPVRLTLGDGSVRSITLRRYL